eukprot:TRINITY_DN12692_c2_g1_i5.p1 TRINITY_DN12692_c2_g1~~TRINITY_DN12692_c2_g1_i5.p1  ORF type:complete len:443 (+),score=74.91 TRINITY_DN12692_c2_g1_i5:41-1330(+)
MRLLAFIDDTKEGKLLCSLAQHLEEGQYELAKGITSTLFSTGSERVQRGVLKLLGDLVLWGTLRSETQEAELRPNVPCWYWYKGTTLGKSGSMTNFFQLLLLVNEDYQLLLDEHCGRFPDEKLDFPCPLLTNSTDPRSRDFRIYLSYLRQGDIAMQLSGSIAITCFESEYTYILQQLLGSHSDFCPPESKLETEIEGNQFGHILFNVLKEQSAETRPLCRHFVRQCCVAAGQMNSATGVQCWTSYLSHVTKEVSNCIDRSDLESVFNWLSEVSLFYTTSADDSNNDPIKDIEELLVPLFTKIRTSELLTDEHQVRVTTALLAAEDPTAAHLYETVCGNIIGEEAHITKLLFKTPRGAEVNWNACLEIAASGHGSPWYLTFQRALQVIDSHLSRGGTDEKSLRHQLQPLFETEMMRNLFGTNFSLCLRPK